MAFGRALGGAMKAPVKAVMPGKSGGGMGAIGQKIGLGPQNAPPMMQAQAPGLSNMAQAGAAVAGRFMPPMRPTTPEFSGQPIPPSDDQQPMMGGGMMSSPSVMPPQMPDMNDPMVQQKMQQLMQQRQGIGPSPRFGGGMRQPMMRQPQQY